jgi:heat shock protein HtpX
MSQMTEPFARSRAINTLHTWLLGAGSLLLLAVTAWAFGGPNGILYAVVFGGVSLWLVRRVSPQMVLAMYKAKPVGAAEFPTGVAIVEELSHRAGLPVVPMLHVIPSKLLNAFAVGRRDESAIAVTDALVQKLSARELAGVLAHEISHIAHEDVRVMAFADMVSRFTSFMSTVGLISLVLNLLGFAGGYGAQVPWFAVLVLLAAPTVGGLLQMALSRTREFDADLEAAILTGDPDGLASALTKLERAQSRLWEGLVLPGGRIPDPSILRSHPVTAERVARLRALKAAPGGPDSTGHGVAGAAPLSRPSLVPKIRASARRISSNDDWPRTPPGTPHVAALVAVPDLPPTEADDVIDDSEPACDRHLNMPESEPRLRLLRGGVWW